VNPNAPNDLEGNNLRSVILPVLLTPAADLEVTNVKLVGPSTFRAEIA
jgi:hypothetical protein